jgi:VIT1/CCC1 family predicted Fe2+/Mn2+ transporter
MDAGRRFSRRRHPDPAVCFLPVPQGRVVSGIVTTLLLVALGVGRAKIGGRGIVRTVFETVSIGVAAAIAGVAIGVFVSHIFT